MKIRLLSFFLLALFLPAVFSGCQKELSGEGAAYARSLGWYDEFTRYFRITTREQVDAMAPGVDFPNVSIRKGGATVTVLQTVANQHIFYALVEVLVDEDVQLYGDEPCMDYALAFHKPGEAPLPNINYFSSSIAGKGTHRYLSIERVYYDPVVRPDMDLEENPVATLVGQYIGTLNFNATRVEVCAPLSWTVHWADISLPGPVIQE